MGSSDFPFTPEEQKMLQEAQTLRDRARASRRKRKEDVELKMAAAAREQQIAAENAKRERRAEFDNRVRRLLLNFTEQMSNEELAIVTGVGYVNKMIQPTSPVILTIEDRKASAHERLRAECRWRYGKGFEWD